MEEGIGNAPRIAFARDMNAAMQTRMEVVMCRQLKSGIEVVPRKVQYACLALTAYSVFFCKRRHSATLSTKTLQAIHINKTKHRALLETFFPPKEAWNRIVFALIQPSVCLSTFRRWAPPSSFQDIETAGFEIVFQRHD